MKSPRKQRPPVILIADPDEEERLLLRAILKLVGFQVIEATNADQLVKLARREPPDLLVLDLTLPRLNGAGVDLIRREAALPTLPVVAVALTNRKTRRPAADASTIFLPKPIEYERFYTLIDRFLPGQMTAFARSKCLPL